MPIQKPGRSKQDYQTPADFISSVIGRFGELSFDLAASPENTQASLYFTEKENGLVQDWSTLDGNLWLNPPYKDISPWARKCCLTTHRNPNPHQRILLLVPASVGSEWYRDYVEGEAYVLALNPRLSFDGKNSYPKDCILAVYGNNLTGFQTWRWK